MRAPAPIVLGLIVATAGIARGQQSPSSTLPPAQIWTGGGQQGQPQGTAVPGAQPAQQWGSPQQTYPATGSQQVTQPQLQYPSTSQPQWSTGSTPADPWSSGKGQWNQQQGQQAQPWNSPQPTHGGWGTDPYAAQPAGVAPGPAPASVLGARQAYPSHSGTTSQSPPAPWVGPQQQAGPASPGGPCTVQVTDDRNTLHVLDAASGLARKHVALGEDRIQKVLASPDGGWALVFAKVRGIAQYYAVAVDLVRCEDQRPFAVEEVPQSVQFEAAEAVLTTDERRRTVKLRSQVVE